MFAFSCVDVVVSLFYSVRFIFELFLCLFIPLFIFEFVCVCLVLVPCCVIVVSLCFLVFPLFCYVC